MPDIFATSWNETDGSNTAVSPAGYADGAVPSTYKQVGRMMMGALKRWFNLASPVYTTGGTSTALTLTPGVAISAYAIGLTVDCILGSDVDAAATLNVSSKGAKKIYVQTQAGLRVTVANEARATNRVRFSYDVTLDSAAGGWVMRDQPLPGAAAGVLSANGADLEPTFKTTMDGVAIGGTTPALVQGTTFRSFTTVSIAADHAISFTPPQAAGAIFVTGAGVNPQFMGGGFFNTAGSTPGGGQFGGSSFAIIATSGSLAGNTGVDGNVTLRADNGTGLIWLENRTGGTRTFIITIIG